MAISDLGIVNSALIKLGVETITALDNTTRQGKIMNEQYAKMRDALTYDHPWNFATKWVSLDENGTAQTVHLNPDYTYEFNLPTGYLRIWRSEFDDDEYEVIDGKLYSNSSSVTVMIIMQVTDPTKFSPAFAEALSLKLAADTCYALVQSNSLKGTYISEMQSYLPKVRSGDAQENPARLQQRDIFLDARR